MRDAARAASAYEVLELPDAEAYDGDAAAAAGARDRGFARRQPWGGTWAATEPAPPRRTALSPSLAHPLNTCVRRCGLAPWSQQSASAPHVSGEAAEAEYVSAAYAVTTAVATAQCQVRT